MSEIVHISSSPGGSGNDVTSSNVLYVDKGGSNINAGTFEKPFLTIAAAITAAASTDIIIVGVGTFTEDLTIAKSVYIQGVSQGKSIISGKTTVTGASSGTVSFKNLHLKNTNALVVDFIGTSDDTTLSMESCRVESTWTADSGDVNLDVSKSAIKIGRGMFNAEGGFYSIESTGDNYTGNNTSIFWFTSAYQLRNIISNLTFEVITNDALQNGSIVFNNSTHVLTVSTIKGCQFSALGIATSDIILFHNYSAKGYMFIDGLSGLIDTAANAYVVYDRGGNASYIEVAVTNGSIIPANIGTNFYSGYETAALPATGYIEIYGLYCDMDTEPLTSGAVHFQISIDDGLVHFSDGLRFGTTPLIDSGDHLTGRMYWDSTWKTPAVDLSDNDVTLQVGQENHVYCMNGESSDALVAGNVVYISGASGGFATVKKAIATPTDAATSFALGVITTSTIAAGGYGYVTSFGNVNDLYFVGIGGIAWTAGTSLYLSETTAGVLTSTPPSEGNYDVRIGRVIQEDTGHDTASGTGRIFVNIRQMSKLTDLGDVTITTPLVDQVLGYNGLEWTNRSAAVVSGTAGIDFYHSSDQILASSAENLIPIHTLAKVPVISKSAAVTISASGNVTVTSASHGLGQYTPVIFTTTGALPSNLTPGLTYYVHTPTTNTYNISTTFGGGLLSGTGPGSGTHTATWGEIINSMTTSSTNPSPAPIAAYLYNTALGRTTLNAGIWDLTNWASMSSTTGNNFFTSFVYKVDATGSVTTSSISGSQPTRSATVTATGTPFTDLYGGVSKTYNINPIAPITNTTTYAPFLQTPKGLYQILTITANNICTIRVPTGYNAAENGVSANLWTPIIQGPTSADIGTSNNAFTQLDNSITSGAYTILITTKLGAIDFYSSDGTARIMYTTHNGPVRNSRITTPLVTLHNNLAGVLGGADYYHLSTNQYAGDWGSSPITTTGLLSYGSADWTGGNVIYVPATGDINAVIAAATTAAGDTLVLASGNYIINANITVGKAVNIVGQGASTVIACTTNSVWNFEITTNNVRIADLKITHTGTTSRGISIFYGTTGTIIKNVVIEGTGAGTKYGVFTAGSVRLSSLLISETSSDDIAHGVSMYNDSGTTAAGITVDIYDTVSVVSTVGIGGAFVVNNGNSTYTITANMFNCCGSGSGDGTPYGMVLTGSTALLSTVNAFQCVFSGTISDVAFTTVANTLNLTGCILKNGTQVIVAGALLYHLGEIPTPEITAPYTDNGGTGVRTFALDWRRGKDQFLQLITGTDKNVITFSNPIPGGHYTLILKQPLSDASATLTWPTSTIMWVNKITPTLTTANSGVDVAFLIYSTALSKYIGSVANNVGY